MSVRETYSLELRLAAVQRYLDGGLGYRKICEQFGIKDKKQLRQWVSRFQNGESLEDRRSCKHARGTYSWHPGPRRTKFASVEEELAYVKAERDYLKKLYRSRFGHEWGAKKVNYSI